LFLQNSLTRLFLLGGIVFLGFAILAVLRTGNSVASETRALEKEIASVLKEKELPSDLQFLNEGSEAQRRDSEGSLPSTKNSQPPRFNPHPASDDPLEKYNIATFRDYPVPTVRGIDELLEAGVAAPALSFDYDNSAEAKLERHKAKLAELVAEGMPEMAAELRAQLFERELADKKARAIHARNRAIVRLRQELKLKRDADQREERLAMIQVKQDMVNQMMERNKQEREDQERKKEEKKREMEAADRVAKDEAEKVHQMREQIRFDHLEKQKKENDARREEMQQDKTREGLEREKAAEQERESKRQMREEFQALRQQQMDQNKRLAREERLQEMQQAANVRVAQQQELGLK
jgi:hypothetical protein